MKYYCSEFKKIYMGCYRTKKKLLDKTGPIQQFYSPEKYSRFFLYFGNGFYSRNKQKKNTARDTIIDTWTKVVD